MALGCLALAVGLVLAPKVHAASGGSSGIGVPVGTYMTPALTNYIMSNAPDDFAGNNNNLCPTAKPRHSTLSSSAAPSRVVTAST